MARRKRETFAIATFVPGVIEFPPGVPEILDALYARLLEDAKRKDFKTTGIRRIEVEASGMTVEYFVEDDTTV